MSPLTPEMQKAVLQLAQTVELSNIRIIEFSARLLSPAPSSEEQVSISVETELLPGALQDGFVVEGRFSLKAKAPGEQNTDFLELHYRLGVVYRLGAEPPPIDTLRAFAETNGMVHLWPYFRTYVQHTCAQLTVPPVTLPLFRVGLSPANASKQEPAPN